MMSGSRPLDTLFHLVHGVKRQLQSIASSIDEDLAPMHIRVIKIIDRKKLCTAIDIANYLNRDKAQVTRLISTLIKKGLITKQPNKDDKRSQFLVISNEGEDVIKAIAQFDKNIMEIMTRGLEENEIKEFERVAKLMTANLE
ncbi:MarR family winged helix-turn-helix transcriptional regulator [Glaciecola sp. 2405UD65-10]|uniref:MarR family winged helix-turn-helix transcriptional regulator n=1 Tax=Glaciecola sp. 2405UD65-10 TaxID=3397244 RepID=UPI003B5B2516